MLYINQELIVPNYMQVEDSNIYYVIKKGDTLWSISKEYGISVSDLKKYNNLQNDFLIPGNTLNIPMSNQIVSNDEENIISEGIIYEVQKGDTLYGISKMFGIPVEKIINQNNLTSELLKIGTKIFVPEIKNETIEYVVQKGDSLWSIARDNNTSVNAIKKQNNLDSDVLRIGMIIKISPNVK